MSAGRRLRTLAPACPGAFLDVCRKEAPHTGPCLPRRCSGLGPGRPAQDHVPTVLSPCRLATAPASGTSTPQACCCLASCRAAPTPPSRGSWRRWVMSCLGACSMTMSCRRTATATATSPRQQQQRQILSVRRRRSVMSPGSLPRLGTGWKAASAQGWWPVWPHASASGACRRRTGGSAWRPRWNNSCKPALRTWTTRRPSSCSSCSWPKR
ncbi:hypothetical protein Celaphus_00013830 [Cervus elaphus hippelaphus]|uniref:Uncharacterized protein n=1 Tax=Cervus elaphus hippelaphus TaxID=46360 RepID=A0A212CCU3_CEREH|nr:hypothetical protein Celaphus_00013830 [Cervus elaphus hippelaphus]